MLILTAGKSLEIKLASPKAVIDMPVIVSYQDITQYGNTNQDAQSNGISVVTICPAPYQNGNPVSRNIKSISIQNQDTISNRVVVQMNNGGTIRQIYTCILSPDDSLFYEHGRGWYALNKFATPITPVILDDMIQFTASGTDTYLGLVPGFTYYSEPLSITVKFTNANTGPATLNINSIGAIPLKNFGNSALVANDIKAGQILDLSYDGTNFQIKSVTDNIQNDV